MRLTTIIVCALVCLFVVSVRADGTDQTVGGTSGGDASVPEPAPIEQEANPVEEPSGEPSQEELNNWFAANPPDFQ